MAADGESEIYSKTWKPPVIGRIRFPFTRDEEEERDVKFYHYSENSDDIDNVLATIVEDLGINQRDTLQVIAISGGDENKFLKKEQEDFLIDEFKELIQNDEPTLIITSGVDSGVVHVIGETLKKIPAWTAKDGHACLGILQDDYRMHDLLEKEGEKKEMLEVDIRNLADNKQKDALLPNRHHTHLLVVQPSHEGHFPKIRQQLQHYITINAHAVRGWSVVLLSVGGALVTIGEVADAVSYEKPIPVVLFSGSGGATDLIINLKENSREEENEEFISSDSELQNLLKRHLPKEFKNLQGCTEKIKNDVKKILKGKQQVNADPFWTNMSYFNT